MVVLVSGQFDTETDEENASSFGGKGGDALVLFQALGGGITAEHEHASIYQCAA